MTTWRDKWAELTEPALTDERYILLPHKDGATIRCTLCSRDITTTPTDRVEDIMEDALEHEKVMHP